jgi:hypothetical protein
MDKVQNSSFKQCVKPVKSFKFRFQIVCQSSEHRIITISAWCKIVFENTIVTQLVMKYAALKEP